MSDNKEIVSTLKQEEIPEELIKDLSSRYKFVEMSNYGKINDKTVERMSGKEAHSLKSEWVKTYKYLLTENENDICSLRAVVETITFKD